MRMLGQAFTETALTSLLLDSSPDFIERFRA